MSETPPIIPSAPIYMADVARIRIRRFKAGSMFKLIFIAVASVWVPLFVLFGIAALFGAKTVHVSGEAVTGLKGLITALIMAPVFTIIITLFAWIGAYVGVRVWGWFRPIELEYVPADR